MCHAGITGKLILGKKSDHLCSGGSRLRDRLRNILRSLTYSREIDTRRRALDRTKLGMSFGKEIVCIHACGKHRTETSCRFIGFNGSGKHHKIGVYLKLFVGKKIGGLNKKRSVRLRM